MTFVLPAIRSRRKPVAATAGIRKQRQNPEETLQIQVCHFLDVALDGNSWYSTIPLGGGGRMRGARLKRAGTKSGIPDIVVTNDRRAIWIELKAARGVLSDAQLYCHAQIRRSRCPVYVCKSLDAVIAALTEAGVPLKATTEPRIITAMRGAIAEVAR